MLNKKDIAIVILNWNGKTLLERFLPSVIKYSEGSKLYLVDNASTDDSLAFVNTHFPDVEIIQNTTNCGYAKGYNNALKYVEEPIYCLLNSDVEVTENWLDPIIESFNNETIGIIQPKILDFKRKDYFEYAGAAGGFIDALGYPYCRGRIFDTLEKDIGQYNDTRAIFWASGACFFIRKRVFESLEGFDESYFAHMEEIDLCWRAFNYGIKTYFVGTSTVYHLGGATLNNENPKKTYLNFRNSLFTLVKNTNAQVFFKTFVRMLLDGVAATRFLLQFKIKHAVAILKAHFDFYKSLGKILKQRKALEQKSGYYHKPSIVLSYFVMQKHHF